MLTGKWNGDGLALDGGGHIGAPALAVAVAVVDVGLDAAGGDVDLLVLAPPLLEQSPTEGDGSELLHHGSETLLR